MVKIILIRHGDTDWNREQIFRGRVDVALNEVGKTQARAVQVWLKDEKVDALYSSPLSRALETARIVGEGRNCEVKTEEGLIDVNFGKWQGCSHKKVKEQYREMYHTWQTKPYLVTFPEGESLKDVKARVMGALEKIIKNHPKETIAMVSHRVVCKVAICAILGLDLSRFWYIKQDTCAINMFEHRDGNYYLSLLNDTCHLRRVEGASPLDF